MESPKNVKECRINFITFSIKRFVQVSNIFLEDQLIFLKIETQKVQISSSEPFSIIS